MKPLAAHERPTLATREPAPQATRDQILSAAACLFGRQGYVATTLRQTRIYRNVSDEARQRHMPVRNAYTRLWDGLLEEAAAAGALRHDIPVPMVRQFLIGALNWPVDWYDPQCGAFDGFAQQITALLFDGIAAGQEGLD